MNKKAKHELKNALSRAGITELTDPVLEGVVGGFAAQCEQNCQPGCLSACQPGKQSGEVFPAPSWPSDIDVAR